MIDEAGQVSLADAHVGLASDGGLVNLQADWLLKGYFQIDDQMAEIRDSLATRLGLPAAALHIAFYPARPSWKLYVRGAEAWRREDWGGEGE